MKIAVLDIETTDLMANNGHIVEVGIVELDTETGAIVGLLDTTVMEEDFGPLYQNAWVFQHTNLDFDRVMKGPMWRDVVVKIQAIADRYPVTAFNKDFDIGYLQSRGVNFPKLLPCIMKTAMNYTKIPRYNGTYKWPKVEEAWKFFFPKEPYTEMHRAQDDAKHEARICFEVIKKEPERWKI
jgi:DNA polymerase-3 subunit epsilon